MISAALLLFYFNCDAPFNTWIIDQHCPELAPAPGNPSFEENYCNEGSAGARHAVSLPGFTVRTLHYTRCVTPLIAKKFNTMSGRRWSLILQYGTNNQ